MDGAFAVKWNDLFQEGGAGREQWCGKNIGLTTKY